MRFEVLSQTLNKLKDTNLQLRLQVKGILVKVLFDSFDISPFELHN